MVGVHWGGIAHPIGWFGPDPGAAPRSWTVPTRDIDGLLGVVISAPAR